MPQYLNKLLLLVRNLLGKLKLEFFPLVVCLCFVGIALLQTTYSRTDLRKLMLETGRRVKYNNVSNEYKWLYGTSRLFDGNINSGIAIPYTKDNTGKKTRTASIISELALTHFPTIGNEAMPQARVPFLIEIYNGHCTQCPALVFRQKTRIKEATLSIILQKLEKPLLDLLRKNHEIIWKKRIRFPDKPKVQKLDLRRLSFFKNSNLNRYLTVGVVLLKIDIHSIYQSPSSLESKSQKKDKGIWLSEIRYADKASINATAHFWE